MRNLFTLLLSLLISFQSLAQYPFNGGFEDWSIKTIGIFPVEAPDGYITIDMFGVLTGLPSGMVSKSTTANSGSYSALLEAKVDSLGPFMILGDLNLTTFDVSNGQACPYSPVTLSGYAKRNLMGTDTALILVSVQNSSGVVAACYSYFVPGTDATFQSFEDSFIYIGAGTPDTLSMISIINPLTIDSVVAGAVTIGSQIYFDDLAIDIGTGIKIPLMSEYNVKSYPNPTNGDIRFEFSGGEIEDLESLMIFDISGKSYIQPAAINGTEININLSHLPSGTYIYQVYSVDGRVKAAGEIVRQ